MKTSIYTPLGTHGAHINPPKQIESLALDKRKISKFFPLSKNVFKHFFQKIFWGNRKILSDHIENNLKIELFSKKKIFFFKKK